jgi:hypothetical protein
MFKFPCEGCFLGQGRASIQMRFPPKSQIKGSYGLRKTDLARRIITEIGEDGVFEKGRSTLTLFEQSNRQE